MDKKKLVQFPTCNVSLGEAVSIVKYHLDDDSIAIPSKVLAIEHVANMETHNSITKDDLVHALRWIFEHYNFGGLPPQAGGGNMTYCNDKHMACEYANIKGECSATACRKELFIPGGQSVVKSRFVPPYTNADRIRAMSDEELANLLTRFAYSAGWTTEIGRRICYEQYQKWLPQPAEED